MIYFGLVCLWSTGLMDSVELVQPMIIDKIWYIINVNDDLNRNRYSNLDKYIKGY